MLPLDTVLTFFVTALMLALAPGPDIIFVLTQSALYGMRASASARAGSREVLRLAQSSPSNRPPEQQTAHPVR